MAGVSITIERMTSQHVLSGVLAAYIYAALIVAGPWIFTVLGLVGLNASTFTTATELQPIFRSIIIYNSMFSLLATTPIAFLSGRHVSDKLHNGDVSCVLPTFCFALSLFCAACVVVVVPFYFLTTTLSGPEKIASIQNAALIGTSWLLLPFLGALRAYNRLLIAFGMGAVAMLLFGLLYGELSTLSALLAFNASFALIDTILLLGLLGVVGSHIGKQSGLGRSLRAHWELPIAGLAYALGIWIDKIIMWYGAPEGGLRVAGSLQTMPAYDTPMFWAQLASIPVIAIMFAHTEAPLGRLFNAFYGRLDQHASKRELVSAIEKIRRFVTTSIIRAFIALAGVATLGILISFVFMDWLGLRPTYMSILRISLSAMVFHTSAMFCFVYLLYFDLRKLALAVVGTHLVLNAIFTLSLMPFGPALYGCGNMFASALTFILGFALLLRELPMLHFHAFITNSASLS